MASSMPPFQVAVIQAAAVAFDQGACLDKACRLIAEAGEAGAKLALFPEAFIPGYPRGMSFGITVGDRSVAGRQWWRRYWQAAIDVPSPATHRLGDAARQAGVYLAIGVVERAQPYAGGTLYCSLLLFDPNGQLIWHHRKLKPTAAERFIWAEGDGRDCRVIDTALGHMSGLICWENYMPLARTALYQQGLEILLAPTADQRDGWQATMRHIALEGRCFVLGCNQYVTREMLPSDIAAVTAGDQPVLSRGGSVIVSPMGDVLAGPLFDQEGMLLAHINLEDLITARFDFDPVGHYARPDVFQLIHHADKPRSEAKNDPNAEKRSPSTPNETQT